MMSPGASAVKISIASWSPMKSEPLTVSYACVSGLSSAALPSAALMPPSAAPECERVGWSFETMATFAPASCASIAARIPAIPAPTTRTSYLPSIRPVKLSESRPSCIGLAHALAAAPSEPAHEPRERVVAAVDDPFLQRDDAVVRDVDSFRADLVAALRDVAESDACFRTHELGAVERVEGVHLEAREA